MEVKCESLSTSSLLKALELKFQVLTSENAELLQEVTKLRARVDELERTEAVLARAATLADSTAPAELPDNQKVNTVPVVEKNWHVKNSTDMFAANQASAVESHSEDPEVFDILFGSKATESTSRRKRVKVENPPLSALHKPPSPMASSRTRSSAMLPSATKQERTASAVRDSCLDGHSQVATLQLPKDEPSSPTSPTAPSLHKPRPAESSWTNKTGTKVTTKSSQSSDFEWSQAGTRQCQMSANVFPPSESPEDPLQQEEEEEGSAHTQQRFKGLLCGEAELQEALGKANNSKLGGNDAFALGNYAQAEQNYSNAIGSLEAVVEISALLQTLRAPGGQVASTMVQLGKEVVVSLASFYANRATCYGKLQEWVKAHRDGSQTVLLRPNWWKGYSINAALYAKQQLFEQAAAQYMLCLERCNDTLTNVEREKIQPRLDVMQRKCASTSLGRSVKTELSGKKRKLASVEAAEEGLVLSSEKERGSSKLASEARGGGWLDGNHGGEGKVGAGKRSGTREHTRSDKDGERLKVSSSSETDEVACSVGQTGEPSIFVAGVNEEQLFRGGLVNDVFDDEEQEPHESSMVPGTIPATVHDTQAFAQTSPTAPARRACVPKAALVSVASISTSAATVDEKEMLAEPPSSPVQKQSKAPPDVIWRYPDFPVVTSEGIKDLVGDDTFSIAVVLIKDHGINQIRTEQPTQSRGPRLLGRCFLKKPSRGRSRSNKNDMCQVNVQFSGNRVSHYSCTCAGYCGNQDASSPENSYVRPCKHVGGVLLVLKKKQEEDSAHFAQYSMQCPITEAMYVSPLRKLTSSQLDLVKGETYRLSQLPTKLLQSMLTLNNQKKTGTKEELVNRCVDGILRGALPRCPLCQIGHLWYAGGKYRCNGSYDRTQGGKLPCSFEANNVQRGSWISEAAKEK